MKLKRNLWKIILIALAIFILLVFIFKNFILKEIGNYLISQDSLEKTQAMFVLGGGAFDRGNEAVKIFEKGFAEKIICTSGNFPRDYEVLGLPYAESDATKINLTRQGVPDRLTTVIRKGTSTFEEAEIILNYCKINRIKKCALLSSKFHTRRMRSIFEKKWKNSGVEFIIYGAPSSSYNESSWWKDEDGLIAVNNEYIKLVYYWAKY